MANLTADVVYALRNLRKAPVFTAVAVGSLALGIGANTAIFTLINTMLLKWLPVKNPQELVVVARNPNRPSTSFNYPDYRYIRDHNKSFDGVIAFSGGGRPISFSVPGKGDSSQLVAMGMVSGNFFDVLGVRPATGRLFNSADNETEGAHPFAVLSYGFWKRVFAEDTSVVGRDVLLNGQKFQIVGVSRDGFTGAAMGSAPDLWVPIVMYRTFSPTAFRWNTRNSWWLTVIGRLRPGATIASSQSEMNVLWQQILEEDPNKRPPATWNKDYKIDNTMIVLPGSGGYSGFRNQTSKPLMILMITVGVVLVIACANVANLLLARAAARRREIAVRLAIGASRSRLIVQLLTESLTLAVLGGIASVAFAWAGVRLLLTFLLTGGSFPIALDLSPDFRVLGFAFALSLLTGIIFGLAPAISASGPDLVPALKTDTNSTSGGRASRWGMQRILVSVQVALSLVLLAGAGLFVRTLSNLKDLDPGMNRENLLFVDTNLGQLGYQPQREREFSERLREEVQRIPGVRAASIAAITPLSGSRWNTGAQVEGYTWRPDEPPHIDMNAVTPRYFESAGIQIVLGRDFRDSDNLPVLSERPSMVSGANIPRPTDPPGPPKVAIVNEAFARKFFGTQPAIGKRFVLDREKWTPEITWEIVGVVRDARYFDIKRPVEPMIYQPKYREAFGSGGGGGGILAVRTTGDPELLINTIRQKVQQIDPNVAITETKTMEDNLNRTLLQERFIATLGGFFGVVALLLASVGLYGVMSQSVARRTREIGIRMALGAEARRLLAMVMGDAFVTVAAGCLVGGGVALVLTRFVEAMLFNVKANDPVTIVAAVLILLGVTAAAAFLPARRASCVQPLEALREQ